MGFVIDAGRLYFSYRLLRNSTDAAALAGAQVLPSSTAITTATQYSGVSPNYNAYANLPNVSMVSGYPKLLCLTSSTIGLPCVNSSGAIWYW